MIPIAESSPLTGGSTELEGPLEPIRSCPADPVHHFVQVALAVYLTPVILVVCLIGGVGIAVGKGTRMVRRLGFRPPPGGQGQSFQAIRTFDRRAGSRPPGFW